MENIYNEIVWSPQESIFKSRPPHYRHELVGKTIPFKLALEVKLKRTFFANFLQEYNESEPQWIDLHKEKLEMLKYELNQEDPDLVPLIHAENNVTKYDMMEMLKELTIYNKELLIDLNLFYNQTYLRLSDCYITETDSEIRKFPNLAALVLTGNWIEYISGHHLPRKLRYLELFANSISDLASLMDFIPRKLHHLGLGRNKLTEDSQLHLLANWRTVYIQSLDLCCNDLCSLATTLAVLQYLPHLHSLQLDGNPCATCASYKEMVFLELPNLIYLDGIMLTRSEKKKSYRTCVDFLHEQSECGALMLYCFRIMGLPQPKKEVVDKKKVVCTYHLEIEVPLLDDNFRNPKPLPPEIPKTEEEEEEENIPKKGGASKKSETAGSSKSSKKKVEFIIYDREDEYELEQRQRVKRSCFKSERVQWTKNMIEFVNPAIIVEAPENDLKALRDTFWCTVPVKVVYLKTLPPEKTKGKPDKGKKTEVEAEAEAELPPQETILKKVTLATIPCHLEQVRWTEKTVDFAWEELESEEIDPEDEPIIHSAERYDGKIQDMKFLQKGQKIKPPKKGEPEIPIEDLPVPIPKIFTCHFGFGFQRISDKDITPDTLLITPESSDENFAESLHESVSTVE